MFWLPRTAGTLPTAIYGNHRLQHHDPGTSQLGMHIVEQAGPLHLHSVSGLWMAPIALHLCQRRALSPLAPLKTLDWVTLCCGSGKRFPPCCLPPPLLVAQCKHLHRVGETLESETCSLREDGSTSRFCQTRRVLHRATRCMSLYLI